MGLVKLQSLNYLEPWLKLYTFNIVDANLCSMFEYSKMTNKHLPIIQYFTEVTFVTSASYI